MNAHSPQQLLDMIHAIDIPAIYTSDMPNDDAAKLVEQRLKAVKRELKDAIKFVGSQYDGRDAAQKAKEEQALLPYQLLEQAIEAIETRNIELETAGIRDQFLLGNVFFGAPNAGWWIGTENQAQSWLLKRQHAEAVGELEEQRSEINEQIDSESRAYENALAKAKGQVQYAVDAYNEHSSKVKEIRQLIISRRKWIAAGLVLILLIYFGLMAFLVSRMQNAGSLNPANPDYYQVSLAFLGIVTAIALAICGYIVFEAWWKPRQTMVSAAKQVPILRRQAQEARDGYDARMRGIQENHEEAMMALRQRLAEVETRISIFEKQIRELEIESKT